MSTVSKYLRGGLAGAVERTAKLFGGFLSIWLLTRVLGGEGYGQYVLGFAVAMFVARVSELGLRYAAIERISSLKETADREAALRHGGAVLAWTALSTGAFSVVLWTAAPFLAGTFKGPSVEFWLRAAAAFVPALALRPIVGGVLRGLEAVPRALALEEILPRSLEVGGLTLVWVFGGDAAAVVVVILVAQYLPLVSFLAVSELPSRLNLRAIDAAEWTFSFKLLLNSVMTRFLSRTDVFMISALAATIADTGAYQIAWSVAMVSQFADSVLTNVIQPRISKRLTAGRIDSLTWEYELVRDLSVLAGAAVVLVVAVAGRPLLGLFGDYRAQYPLLLLLAVGRGVLVTSFGPVGQFLLMDRRGTAILVRSGLVVSANLVGNYLLIPVYGTLGAGTTTVATAFLFANVLSTYLVHRYVGIVVVDPALSALSLASLGTVTLYAFGVLGGTTVPIVTVLTTAGYVVARNARDADRIRAVIREGLEEIGG